jgi:hypothetical protein
MIYDTQVVSDGNRTNFQRDLDRAIDQYADTQGVTKVEVQYSPVHAGNYGVVHCALVIAHNEA